MDSIGAEAHNLQQSWSMVIPRSVADTVQWSLVDKPSMRVHRSDGVREREGER